MTWYRGTKSEPIAGQTVRGTPSYFTNTLEVAKGYAKGEKPGRVIEAQLQFKNPKVEKSARMVILDKDIRAAKAEGYDAIIQDLGKGEFDAIVFDPAQVKLKPTTPVE